MKALVDTLGAVNAAIGRGGRVLAGGILAVMLLVIMAQVMSRYVFNNSLAWTEELSKSLMVWTTFLVAPWALRTGANVGIDLFAAALPARLRYAVEIVISALVLWILFIMLKESVGFVERGLKSRMSTLPVSTGFVYAIIPLSLAAMMLSGVEILLRQFGELASGVEDPKAPHRRPPTSGE